MVQDNITIAELIEKYQRLVFTICLNVVNDAHLAEDITHDVFERLLKVADTLLALDEPKQIAYISVVAKNRAIDVSKKEHTQKRITKEMMSNNLMYMDIMVKTPFVDEYGFSIEMRDIILSLDDLERDIIILKYGLGYTYKDISRILEQKERYVYYKAKIAHKKVYSAIVGRNGQNEKKQ